MENIPVVDFARVSMKDELEINDIDVKKVADELCQAFSSIGFAYIINHTLDDDTIKNLNNVSGQFFGLPRNTKAQYRRAPYSTPSSGWIDMLGQRAPGVEQDLKENINYTPFNGQDFKFPEKEVPQLLPSLNAFYEKAEIISKRILLLIGIGLKLKEPDFFVKCHQHSMLEKERSHTGGPHKLGATTVRVLYYPPIPDDYDSKNIKMRINEHSDVGSLTLLFQDGTGGLELLTRNNKWVQATPADGAMIVNIGDVMQRWTGDKLISTRHRVPIPTDEKKRKFLRRSCGYFVAPDYDVMITPLDGFNKYQPISALDHMSADLTMIRK